jgi:DNA-binding beta-propeller fold protein YncE
VLEFGLDDFTLRATYGCGTPGLLDGSGARARFNAPQGLALRGDALFVADTENHALRRISLDTGGVTTVAGTGAQSTGQPVGPANPASPPAPAPARTTALNSPWDVLTAGDRLYISMAGSHQLWRLHVPSGLLELVAGDGREALEDGPPLSARLAQPSGLATDGERLWFVDSETSSLRSLALDGSGEVATALGLGLFEFGDVDGARPEARLQHPLGVACVGGRVYVADSYNNKVREFDPASGVIRTLSGGGEPGLHDGVAADASFWEPGGLSAAGDVLYVADTNNHAVRAVDRHTGEVFTLPLDG